MPLSKVSYPYVEPLEISNATIESLFTNAQTFASPFTVQSNSPTATALVVKGATSQSADIFQVQNSIGTLLTRITSNGNTVFSGGVNIFEGDVRVGTSSYFSGALSVSARVASEIGAVVRGFAGQTSSLQEWQDSAGSVQSAVASDGTFSIKQIRNVGGSVNRLVLSDASSTVIVNSGNTGFVGLSVRRFNDSQTGDLQQWTNSNAGTVFAKVDASGNFTVQNDTPRIRALRGTATAQTSGLGADNGEGWVGSETNTPFYIASNNTRRLTLSADGTTATFVGAVIAPAATTAIPSLRAPHGTAPTTPTNGDIWTTTTGLFVRINGTTVSPILNPMTAQLQSTLAWNAADNQGQIYLNGATGNRLDFNNNGSAAPAFTTRSAGTKIVLNSAISGVQVDHAIGIDASTTWFSVPTTASHFFRFYGGTTNTATLAGTGALTLSSSATATSFIPSGSTVPSNGMYLSAANTLNLSTNTTSRLVIDSSGNTSLSGSLTTGTIAINRSDASLEGGEIQLRRSVDNAVGFTVDIYGSTTSPDFRIFNNAGTQVLTYSTAGLLTVPSGLTVTSGTLSINGASPTIASTNASAASIFTSTVTGITIGSSSIKTTKYPAAPSGTTTGTVTQAAQLSGYLGMPVNQQGVAATALSYTLVASDAGKMIYVQSTPTTPTITIPANSAVAFEIGTTIVVMNDIGAATNVSIAITTDTLQLVSTGLTGTRTLARYGMATLVKVTATKWIITGNGVT